MRGVVLNNDDDADDDADDDGDEYEDDDDDYDDYNCHIYNYYK